MKIRTALKRFRAQRGLTQQELARLTGLSRQTLVSIESGKSIPSTAIALHLAKLLGCRVEELFELDEPGGDLRATLAEPMRASSPRPSPRDVVGAISSRWLAHRLDPQQRPRDLTVAADAVLAAPAKGKQVRLRAL